MFFTKKKVLIMIIICLVVFIFSYNDESKVNEVLKKRMYRIHTKGYQNSEKKTAFSSKKP